MVGMLTQNIILITNTAFLGRVGEVELGICAMGGIFYFVMVMTAMGFSNGAQVIMARRLGEKRPLEIGNVFLHALYILFFYALISFIVLRYSAAPLLENFIEDKLIFRGTIDFLSWRSWGIYTSMLGIAFNAFYIGVGRTRVIMYSALATALLNIVLDYGLIFGHFGLPKMGVNGAALSSNISEVGGVLVALVNIFLHDYIKSMRLFIVGKFNKVLLQQILNISYPLVIQYCVSVSAWYLFFITIENMGSHQLAISNIMRSIMFLFTISCWALGNACNSLVSRTIGEGRKGEVISLIKKTAWLSFLITLSMMAILVTFFNPIMHVYTSNSNIIEDSFHPVLVMALGIILLSAATVTFQGVQGTGSTKFNMFTELFAVALYLAYLLLVVNPLGLSLAWAWLAESIYWLFIISISAYYLSRGYWRNIEI